MFTGLVTHLLPITTLEHKPHASRVGICFPADLLARLELGASVAVNGVCLTVTHQVGDEVFFDVMQETLQRTTFRQLTLAQLVNIERSAKFGDEIGGHCVSGHVSTTATVIQRQETTENLTLRLQLSAHYMKYIFDKGYIALNGVSLTLCDPDLKRSECSVHLIPETRRRTNLGDLQVGDAINVEFDSQTQTIVDTVIRLQAELQPENYR